MKNLHFCVPTGLPLKNGQKERRGKLNKMSLENNPIKCKPHAKFQGNLIFHFISYFIVIFLGHFCPRGKGAWGYPYVKHQPWRNNTKDSHNTGKLHALSYLNRWYSPKWVRGSWGFLRILSSLLCKLGWLRQDGSIWQHILEYSFFWKRISWRPFEFIQAKISPFVLSGYIKAGFFTP